MKHAELEFWFEYGSTYTYLTVARMESVALAKGLSVLWRPFLLMPILIEHGLDKGPFLGHPAKLRYMWRDLERRAKRHELGYRRPSAYPPNTLLTARIGLLGQREGWCADFTREVFRLHWTEDVSIGSDDNIRRSLASVGKDVHDIRGAAETEANKRALRDQTSKARDLGIFGSPTFVVGEETFWGDDRLEDAIEFAGSE